MYVYIYIYVCMWIYVYRVPKERGLCGVWVAFCSKVLGLEFMV